MTRLGRRRWSRCSPTRTPTQPRWGRAERRVRDRGVEGLAANPLAHSFRRRPRAWRRIRRRDKSAALRTVLLSISLVASRDDLQPEGVKENSPWRSHGSRAKLCKPRRGERSGPEAPSRLRAPVVLSPLRGCPNAAYSPRLRHGLFSFTPSGFVEKIAFAAENRNQSPRNCGLPQCVKAAIPLPARTGTRYREPCGCTPDDAGPARSWPAGWPRTGRCCAA